MFRAGALLLLAATLVAATPIPVSKEHRSDHPGSHQAHAGNGNAAPQPAPRASERVNKKPDKGTRHAPDHAAKHDGEAGPRWTDIAIVFLTLGLLIAALLQFFAALLQWRSMRGQERQMRQSLIDARRAANRQAREAKRQADQMASSITAAMQANAIAKDAVVIGNRAWLKLDIEFREPMRVYRTPVQSFGTSIEANMSFDVYATNLGKTPALHGRFRSSVGTTDMPDMPESAQTSIDALVESAPGGFCNHEVIFPGERVWVDGYSGPCARQARIYACGVYRVAGSEVDHFTAVCFSVVPDVPSAEPTPFKRPEHDNVLATTQMSGPAHIT